MIISILFILVMFFVAVIAIGTSLLRGIINLFFNGFQSRHHRTRGDYGQSQTIHNKTEQAHQSSQASNKKREKIFDDTEGEYVDFEEIK